MKDPEYLKQSIRRRVRGGGAVTSHDGVTGSVGGYIEKDVYLPAGAKYLIWGGSTTDGNWGGGQTGYPGGSTDYWGGTGATGHSEGGGGGGGAASNGRSPSHWDAAPGAAGAGCIIGINENIQGGSVDYMSHTESSWTRNINTNSFGVGPFSVDHLLCVILAGGGAGATGKDNSHRTGGGGGGAYGDGGGTSYWTVVSETSGPGGTWGKGANGIRYGAGGLGAWAVLDFTTNSFTCGVGGGTANVPGWVNIAKWSTE